MNWIKAQWRQVSTKLGVILAAIGPALQQYAQYDVKFAYASAAIGVALIVFQEKPGGD